MQHKTGIGIPAYNNVQQLRQCLQSLANQESHEFDVHIFDDASDDDYQELIKEFSSLTISYHRRPHNLGALQNMEQSFDDLAPAYRYVMIMHEDDLLHPQFIQTAYNALKSSDETALFVSPFEEFEAGSSPVFNMVREDDLQAATASAKSLCSLFLEGRPFAFGSAVYDTAVYKKMNLDVESYAEFADRPFLLQHLKDGYKAAFISRPFYSYRSHGPADSRWKKLRPVHVYKLLDYYKRIIQPRTRKEKRTFKKQATAFIFESTKNLQLAGSLGSYPSYLWEAFKKGLLSLKYLLLQNNKINHAGTRLKKTFS